MVAVQPTRGLDVGAIEGVHRLLLAQREAGAAVLLISEELEELLSLSDRVYVIYEGKIMGEVKVESSGTGPESDRNDWFDDDRHTAGTNPEGRSCGTWLNPHPYRNNAQAFGSELSRGSTNLLHGILSLVSLGAIVVALILGGIVIALAGGDPFRSYATYCARLPLAISVCFQIRS